MAVMSRLAGPPESTILGLGTKVSPTNAAFANGALVHALNYDPIGSEIGHVGVVGLVDGIAEAFDEVLGDRPNQVDKRRDDVQIGAAELLSVAQSIL